MLQELFNSENTIQNKKHDSIQQVYQFVRDNPSVLVNSIHYFEQHKDKLLQKVAKYKKYLCRFCKIKGKEFSPLYFLQYSLTAQAGGSIKYAR